jgi:hypothetical protein
MVLLRGNVMKSIRFSLMLVLFLAASVDRGDGPVMLIKKCV